MIKKTNEIGRSWKMNEQNEKKTLKAERIPQ